MAKNSDYWKSRMQALENAQYEKSLEYYEDLKEQFRQALNGMQMDIELWYRRLAENNDISYAAAKRLMKSKELEEFKWTVEQYIQAGEENAVDQRWMKQLENASARHHISYLEAMKLQTQQYAEVLYTQFEGGITDYLTKNFAEQFYHTAFEISKGVGIGFNLARLDTKAIDTAIRKPWAMDGKNFSDRIWENKDKLVRNLHTELSQCIIRGTDPGKAINSLAKKMNVSKSQAGNLIMTEMAAISAAAQKKCFEELNVEAYEFDATLDGKTCEVCGRMDHKVFRMSDYQVGVTAPPIHPRCRCDTSPYFDDWEEFGIHVQRAARDPETGKTVYVDGNLNYEEWSKQLKEKEQKNLETSALNGTMKAEDRIYEGIPKTWEKLDVADDDLRAINPGYHQTRDRKYRTNCPNCVCAYEFRKRGYNVIAKPEGKNHHLNRYPEDAWIDPEIKSAAGNGLQDIQSTFNEWGNGVRAEISAVYISKNNVRTGHVFVAEKIDGKVMVYDPQSGTEVPERYFEKVEDVRFWRIDNLDMSDRGITACEPGGKHGT